MRSYLGPKKILKFAAKNAYRLPYKSTTAMYWMADLICPEYESEEINTLLKIIPTMAVVWACTSPPLLTLMALGYNYQTSLDNLESQSTYQELRALANGDAPRPQGFKAYHHITNLFCVLNFGIPGTIVASFINRELQNWWDNPANKQAELDYLKNAADRREGTTITRLEANPAFIALPEQTRTIIATQIAPALAEFSHRNDNRKQREFVYAAAHLLKATLVKNNIIIPNATASALLSAVCNNNNAYVANVSNHVRNNNGFTSTAVGFGALDPAGMQTAEQLTNTFASRIEKIAAVRGRG